MKTKLTFQVFGEPDITMELTDSIILKASRDNTYQTYIGFAICEKLVTAYGTPWKTNAEVIIDSPHGPQKRQNVFIQLQYLRKLDGKKPRLEVDYKGLKIPIYCDCCEDFTPKLCKDTQFKTAYLTAKTVLSAVPLPREKK